MEFLNKIELRGIVGLTSLNRVGESQVCRFSLVTEYSYKDRDNNPVVDTTWFNVTAWEGKNMPDLRQIAKGVIVQVAGRVRTFRYTMAERLGDPGPPRHHPPVRRRPRATPKIPVRCSTSG